MIPVSEETICLSNIIKSLAFLILIVFTGTFRLASLQQDIQEDLWQAGLSYDTSEATPNDTRDKCDAEDNDADDQDIDLVFLNEDPKQNLAIEGIQKPSRIFSNICFKFFNHSLINPYWETLFEKMESPGNTPFLTSLPLRSPPYFTL